MRLDATKECLICNYCGNIVFPQPNQDGVRVLGAPGAIQCPVCHTGLVDAALAGHPIFYCEQCRGMLISIDDFLPVVAEERAELGCVCEPPHRPDWNEMQRSIDCPRCHQRMDTHPYAGPGAIIIDNCPRCRVNWLDHNELGRIVRAADSAGPNGWRDPLAPAPEPESTTGGGVPPRWAFFEQQAPQAAQIVENAPADGHVLSKILQFIRHQL